LHLVISTTLQEKQDERCKQEPLHLPELQRIQLQVWMPEIRRTERLRVRSQLRLWQRLRLRKKSARFEREVDIHRSLAQANGPRVGLGHELRDLAVLRVSTNIAVDRMERTIR
jgi:hypothetical protein